MKECAKVRRLLSRYLDKETTAADTVLVDAHLDSCALCKKEFSELSRVQSLISGKERKALPPDFLVSRLREEIARERRDTRFGLSWLESVGNLSRKLIPVPVTAIALSLIFLVLTNSRQSIQSSLDEQLLSGTQATTETAWGLILGTQND